MTYPILEYDPTPTALIEPASILPAREAPEHCVVCFFGEVVQKVAEAHGARAFFVSKWEDGPHPFYEMTYRGRRLAFFQPGVGAPFSAALLEDAIALGCRKFMVCGGAGVLERGFAVGDLIVVSAAVRDEGTSYHYLPPAREVEADPAALQALVDTLEARGLPYVVGKTWTTDGLYRETAARVARRRAEGCLTVEMEAAALMAVARFRGVPLAQVLYAGDDLSGPEWDEREWQSRSEVREMLFWVCADAVLRL